MRKIVLVHRKKKYHFKKYFGKKRHYARKKKNTFRKKKNGSFLEGSSLKEKLRKLALYAGDQAILLKIA